MTAVNLIANDFTKVHGTPDQLTATLKDGNTPLVGSIITFTINGVSYHRETDVTGTARLNINLDVGVFPCNVLYAGSIGRYDSASKDITVTVLSRTRLYTEDMQKKSSETKQFICKVRNGETDYNIVSGNITFKVNGVTYIRSIKNGIAKLNIRLKTGTFTITSTYNREGLQASETVTNKIIVTPDIADVTLKENLVTTPPSNRGFMESKIFVKQYNPEYMKEGNKLNLAPEWTLQSNLSNPIEFTSYEITETDPRVKTARFTTPEYFDLTNGQLAVLISSPYHENFGGLILKIEYDKSTKLYTYQCQDGRRQYISKAKLVTNGTANAYDILENLLVYRQFYQGTLSIPIPEDVRQRQYKILSGLRPIEDYNIMLSPIIGPENNLKNTYPEILSYDTLMDKIMNIAHTGQTPIDVYFTTDMTCQIEPIDINTWINTGLRLVHSDLSQYKYSFDTTNIITRVSVKNNTSDMSDYQDWNELRFYFGQNRTIIDPATTQTSTASSNTGGSNVGSGLMSGKKTFVVGADNINGRERSYINTVISKLQSAGHSTVNVGVGPSVVQNYGLKSASKGKIAVFIVGGSDAGTYSDFVAGLKRGYYHYDHAIFFFASNTATTDKWLTCNGLANTKLVRAHDDNFSRGTIPAVGKTAKQYFSENSKYISYVCGPKGCTFDSVATKLVNGNFGSDGVATNTVNITNTNSTTIVDTISTYNKVLEEVTKSIRDLLSFEIRVPLNSTLFKDLHTNQMLFTELPREFKLGNLEKIFKILPSFKVNRGVPYQENRWYVEGVKTKMDSSGLFADITLNPFPSSYSVYANAVKSYADAYNQAFNSSSNITSSNGNTVLNNGTGLGSPLLGNDCTSTNSMRAMSGGGYGNSGHGKNFDSAAQRGYAVKDANYYTWARQYSNVKDLLHALASKHREQHPIYFGNKKCPQKLFNSGTIYSNCYDGCRLVKVCCDACGFPCVIITGNIWGWSHGWNAVKYNGTWYTFDLLFVSKGNSTKGTNSFRSVW